VSRLQALTEKGQAIWLDYIRRDMLEDGGLEAMVQEDGITGVTSNPAIFNKAIGETNLYDDEIQGLLADEPNLSTLEIYERLAFSDIRKAADVLAPVFDRTKGADGFVSLEVSPHLARDTEGTLEEARRFWQSVNRPNLMIKVPATVEGIPATEELLASGIHVNITLMFSLRHYEDVAAAYLRGVERSAHPERAASVASFFVSRVDSLIDRRLGEIGTAEASGLRGRVAIANSKLTYARYREIFEGESFALLGARGARPQRVLWASTSTKNPDYRDVLYVEDLIGPETVNTLPPATLEAFRDHGEAAETLTAGLEEAWRTLSRLESVGVDLAAATEELQEEGLAKFAHPFDQLLASLEEKRQSLEAAVTAGG
ncbi:MAG: transaldolase, partial [Acidobacteriota bacterium]|nr:transaldolase [Acidobacteriota bacterium]